ncbi:MAG: hypothetical protein BKP49_07130 [Treponema sp. CETP13]|nr:MAG: hypothetical protein BKP49_07130 [Treponema sp. CETP13]
MKKIYTFITILVCIFSVFAQTSTNNEVANSETRTQAINELTQTTVEKEDLYTLTISYTESIDEAYFTYTINSSLFEQGEAMKVLRLRIDKFVKEHGYYFYTYLGADVTKYDNTKELAIYTSHIKFLSKNTLTN